MNYEKIYALLISRAHDRKIQGPTEKHHIIPKCMGGSNAKSNLVKLTPEEHFVAHQLLARIYPKEKGLIYALVVMVGNRWGHRNNKAYGWIRRLVAEQHSKASKELWQDPAYREKQLKRLKLLKDDPEWKAKISTTLTGRKKTNEERENIRQSRLAAPKRTFSDAAKAKMKISQQARRAKEALAKEKQ
jgi:hypothetical protein